MKTEKQIDQEWLEAHRLANEQAASNPPPAVLLPNIDDEGNLP